MSGTIKKLIARKKNRSPRIDKATKTSIKVACLKSLWQDSFKNSKNLMVVALFLVFVSSCVSTKEFALEQQKTKQANKFLSECSAKNENIIRINKELQDAILQYENQLANERNKYNLLEQQLEYFKSSNTNLLDRLSDFAIINKTGAESIKKSLEAINGQNVYIKDLTSAMRKKDSLNLALVMNLKKSLVDINDDDVNIEVKKGVVYISISDKLLFKSGSYEISARAEEVLGKIARVLNDQKQLDILVEGHTDDVPISTACISDNWDLSVKRATTVVRYLQDKHKINPERMTAGGRSEYVSKTSNTTPEGKATNRRTEIIVLPQLDQFFQLLEPPTQ